MMGRENIRQETQSGLPRGWRRVRIGDVVTVLPGQHILEADYVQHKCGIGYITGPADFGYEKPLITKWTEKPKATCEPIDVLVTVKGAGVGKINLAPDEKAAIGRQLMAIRPDLDTLNLRFLFYFLRSCIQHFQDTATGSTVPGLDRDSIESLCMPLPPLDEQKRIVAILNVQLPAVEKARKAIEQNCNNAKLLPMSYLRELFSKLKGDIQRTATLGDILYLRKDVIHPYNKPRGPAVFIGLEHVESGTRKLCGSQPVEMSELTGRKPRFHKGDIVYGYLRPYLNKVWVADFDGLCSVDQYVYEVNKDEALNHYVAWFMRSPIYLEDSPVGKTHGWLPRIRTDEVARIEMVLPSISEQEKIVDAIHAKMKVFDTIISSTKEQLTCVGNYPYALLNQAFSGSL